MKIIFDNDGSTDDIIALIYLLTQPKVEVEGITIAGTGEVHGLQGAINLANVSYLLNKPDVPIAYGTDKPCSNDGKAFPTELRELIDKILVGKSVPSHPAPNITSSAVELIKKIAESGDEKKSILATGPLTNIAEFIQAYPNLKNKIEKIVIMGGAVKVQGNIKVLDPNSDNTVAEWNIYADPKAAEIVFTSGIPVTLVPLDATNQVPMTEKFYQA